MRVVVLCRQYIGEMIGNVSDWLSCAGGTLIKVTDSAGSTVQYSNSTRQGERL